VPLSFGNGRGKGGKMARTTLYSKNYVGWPPVPIGEFADPNSEHWLRKCRFHADRSPILPHLVINALFDNSPTYKEAAGIFKELNQVYADGKRAFASQLGEVRVCEQCQENFLVINPSEDDGRKWCLDCWLDVLQTEQYVNRFVLDRREFSTPPCRGRDFIECNLPQEVKL